MWAPFVVVCGPLGDGFAGVIEDAEQRLEVPPVS